MEELAKKISAEMIVFDKNLSDNIKGNKAAGVRARKASLELEKLFKQYRKLSVKG
ncbi:MAG: histone H1 [Lachnospiraceae bacterium]|nr:histone H1 [Lachnospiraceae bacterium]